jgi:hypothetical protein
LWLTCRSIFIYYDSIAVAWSLGPRTLSFHDCFFAKPKELSGQETCILEDIVGSIFLVSGELHPLENNRKDKQEGDSHYDT